MIAIYAVTSTGTVRLDLPPDLELEIKSEQPLLSDDMPVPWSSQIAFPITATNQKVFQLLSPAATYAPFVRSVACRIVIDGVPLFTGTLEYDGLDGGKLLYTFTAQGIDNCISQDFSTTDAVYAETLSRGPLDSRIMIPLIVNKNAVAKTTYYTLGVEHIDFEAKYRNFIGYDGNSRLNHFVQSYAASIRRMISFVFGSSWLDVSSEVAAIFNQMSIVCLYGNKIAPACIGSINEDNFPKITFKDVLDNCCRILCAGFFLDGNKARLINARDVLVSGNVIVLDGKVSDEFSTTVEPAVNYEFKFGNDESEDTYNPDNVSGTATSAITQIDAQYDNYFNQVGDYGLFRDSDIGDIYSRKVFNAYLANSVDIFPGIVADIVFRLAGACRSDVSASDTKDRSTSWKLVRCVPDKVPYRLPDPDATPEDPVMAAVIPPVASDAERGDEVYVGLLKNVWYPQLVDKSFYFDGNGDIHDDGVSLAPKDLWPLHKDYAEWLGKDRQCVKVKLNVSTLELQGMKMWNRYFFDSRYWLLKSLTIRVRTLSARPEVEAELIEI
ncbi:MAG: hypothetical protein IJS66_04255 [Bacteroidales bacterium]|nr:hypothetical protein [Bacteroidales bacterium]